MRRLVAILSVIVAAIGVGLAAQTSSAGWYFPPATGAWESVTPGQARWNEAALERALDFARDNSSTGVVIVHRGRLLAERYWPGRAALPPTRDGKPVEDVASVQKSVISVLMGIAVERNLVSLDAPVSKYLGAGWSQAQGASENAITIRHLMSMSSGLDEALQPQHQAGHHWFYNTPAYSRLITVLARASGLEPNVYTTEWLASQIGMTDTRWIARPEGGPNPYGLATTARDLARFGLLVLARGKWNGVPIVSERYLAESVRPSQTMNPSYGLLWWNNSAPGRPIPSAPPDVYSARGAADRRVYVVPSLDVVITRLGALPPLSAAGGLDPGFDRELWKRLAEAAPGR
jgi:CubicO group peptidase (beta-lactamase class C family)